MNAYSKPIGSGESATDKAREAAADMTHSAAEKVVETASAIARTKRNSAAFYVSSLGAAANAASRSLADDGCANSADRLSALARVLDDTSDRLVAYDVRALVDSAAELARKNPALTFGLAALTGYALVKMADTGRTSHSLGGDA